MKVLSACVTAGFLLAGCEQPPTENQAADHATSNAAAAAKSPQTPHATLGAPVSGEQAKTLMHDRHEGMEEIGDAMKALGREMKVPSPDLAVVRTHAGNIAHLAPQVSGWFPPGTGPDVGKTEAKAAIWENPQDFAVKRTAFQQSAARLNELAQGNDVTAIKAAHGDLGKNCKACHDLYREEH